MYKHFKIPIIVVLSFIVNISCSKSESNDTEDKQVSVVSFEVDGKPYTITGNLNESPRAGSVITSFHDGHDLIIHSLVAQLYKLQTDNHAEVNLIIPIATPIQLGTFSGTYGNEIQAKLSMKDDNYDGMDANWTTSITTIKNNRASGTFTANIEGQTPNQVISWVKITNGKFTNVPIIQ